MIFDLSSNTIEQRATILEALARCTFDFELLRPGLQQQTGKDSIPVQWLPTLENFRGNPVLAYAYDDGRIELSADMERDTEVGGGVFLHEAGHLVDRFYLTDEHRRRILIAYSDEPSASWFDEQGEFDYADWIGESWAQGFVVAFSDYRWPIEGAEFIADDFFTNKSTEEVAAKLREIVKPTDQELTLANIRARTGIS